VILEIGYFLGLLGKERIRMIVKGEVEIPSDLQGILYEKHDKSGAWKIKLLKELQAVGIYVDIQAAINEF
jgi:predicted nucleotide-binding protein